MSIPVPTVFIVDADIVVRESLCAILHEDGLEPEAFASVSALLARPRTDAPSCLLLDASQPGLEGLALQEEVMGERPEMSIVMTTVQGNVPMTVRAMKAGAIEVLMKPLGVEVVLRAVREGIDRSTAILAREAQVGELRQRTARLSTREREVMRLVVSGLLNKQVGAELGISEITVKAHRGKVMRKMCAGSFAELVRMASSAGLEVRARHDAA